MTNKCICTVTDNYTDPVNGVVFEAGEPFNGIIDRDKKEIFIPAGQASPFEHHIPASVIAEQNLFVSVEQAATVLNLASPEKPTEQKV